MVNSLRTLLRNLACVGLIVFGVVSNILCYKRYNNTHENEENEDRTIIFVVYMLALLIQFITVFFIFSGRSVTDLLCCRGCKLKKKKDKMEEETTATTSYFYPEILIFVAIALVHIFFGYLTHAFGDFEWTFLGVNYTKLSADFIEYTETSAGQHLLQTDTLLIIFSLAVFLIYMDDLQTEEISGNTSGQSINRKVTSLPGVWLKQTKP